MIDPAEKALYRTDVIPKPTVDKPQNSEFQGRMARLEELIQALEQLPDETARSQAREIVQVLLELHGNGVNRMLELAYEAERGGQPLIDRLAQDDLISHLLLLHGLHPIDLETRVRNAIETVRPRLAQHGGSVEFLEVSRDGALRLRLEGNCHGCPSSILTLKFTIEEAIYAAAPDITSLEVEGAGPLAPPVAHSANGTAPAVPKFTECPTT